MLTDIIHFHVNIMRYWYFLFEGIFKEGAYEDNFNGVFSSVLLPALDKKHAIQCLKQSLDKEQINLVKIDDDFELIINNMDMSDEDNKYWINWFDAVVKENGAVFTPWQVFSKSD